MGGIEIGDGNLRSLLRTRKFCAAQGVAQLSHQSAGVTGRGQLQRMGSADDVAEGSVGFCRIIGMDREVISARHRWYHVRRETLFAVLVFCLLSFMVSRWILWPVKISGESMQPNYNDGQPTFINRLAYLTTPPRRGDVVGLHVNGEFYLKRVIGLPGEKLEFKRDTVVVDGQPLEEHYVVKPLLWRLPAVHLGADDYFVMGDNRPYSMLGAVRREHIIGKALF